MAFKNIAYLRIGSATPKLTDYPERYQALLSALRPYAWEHGIALQYVTSDDVLSLLDYAQYFRLTKQPLPDNRVGILDRLKADQLIAEDVGGRWNITNLGAILFAVDLTQFSQSLARKGVRFIGYDGTNKASPVSHRQDGKRGYAAGFEGLIGYTPNPPEEITEADFIKVMDWNARGTFLCIQSAVPVLKADGGSIVNMASMSGRIGWTMFSPQYSAAKAAIIGLTRNYAAHLGKYGIRVNALAPGFIEGGNRARAMWDARDNTQVLRDIALGRRGENAELANVALFLASDLSSYVTGCVIDVNGGYLNM